ncbi:MAG: prenyltransferase/squalene oxidase repeat-containing protein [Caldilineaceae bacterium]
MSVYPRSIASTPYDTAWVAAIPHPAERRDPRFPTALNWISQNQWPDGSWGSSIPYLHDRIICTLAALIPLVRFGRRQVDYLQVVRGERYLWQHAHLLEQHPCELVGFELLLPALAENAANAGVKLPPYVHAFRAERERKLKMLPEHMLYSNQVTVAHSLEFLGSSVDPIRLASARGSNGSIGNSPAATAFLLHYLDDPDAVAYIERCLSTDEGTAVPVLDPCETFDDLWSAQHQWLGGEPASSILTPALIETLDAGLKDKGVSLSPSFPVPDADETAVALILFHEAGIPADPCVLQMFERDDYFVSFQYERHPSVGVNIHALMALLRYPEYPNRQAAIEKVIAFLRQTRQQGSFWTDKWHISPHYATGRAVVALLELHHSGESNVGDELLQPALEWLLETQNEDGSWGHFAISTVEETAYALLALRHIPNPDLRVQAAIDGGKAYVLAHQNEQRPAMWIDKCLYYPSRIVETAIISALH